MVVMNFISLLSEYDLSVFLYHPPIGLLVLRLSWQQTKQLTIDAQAMAFVYTVVLMIISTFALWLGRFGGFEAIKNFAVKAVNKIGGKAEK